MNDLLDPIDMSEYGALTLDYKPTWERKSSRMYEIEDDRTYADAMPSEDNRWMHRSPARMKYERKCKRNGVLPKLSVITRQTRDGYGVKTEVVSAVRWVYEEYATKG